ncbi:MAG: hypothetical protein U0350_41035 [Caldilineaceae bacterium]
MTNRAERILVESKDNAIVYGIAAAHNRVVWSWLDHQAKRTCQDEAVLSLLDLTNDHQIELNRACFQTEHHWRAVSMDGDRLVAEFWQATSKPGKALGDIALFNLNATDLTQFTLLHVSPAGQNNALPSITGNWVLWARSTGNETNCLLFDLRTDTQLAPPPGWQQANCPSAQSASGYFFKPSAVDAQSLILYQPERHTSINVQPKTKGLVGPATVFEDTVALAVRINPEQAQVINSVVEWTHLDHHP